MSDDAILLCEYSGHEWGEAGGGLLMCLACGVEKWEGERDPRAPLDLDPDPNEGRRLADDLPGSY